MIPAVAKSYLKRIGWLYELNARWKAKATKRQYCKTQTYYAAKKQANSFEELMQERLRKRVDRIRKLDRSLRMFLLGTDELQDRSGILQALEKLGQVIYFTRADGSYGQNCIGPPKERSRTNGIRLWELVKELHDREESPDLLIAQTRRSYIDGAVLSRIRDRFGTIIINIAMDDRHQYWGKPIEGQWGGTFGLIPHIDLALTAAAECVGWYLKEGCPAVFFPEASDPNIFHPRPDLPKIHDVCFVGARYGIRKHLVGALQRDGIKVTAYGNGWPNGRIPTEDVPRLFAQAKIIIGVGTIGHCTDFYALKMRDFDGPMSGSLYITHDNPDLYDLYEIGKEIVTYRTTEECVLKVIYYLNHPEKTEAIAKAGYERAIRSHSWRKRFEKIFSILGAL
jgi:hypothetical protein